ncbi:MAG: acetolactate decarboxylase [Flavobacteriales bacterium]|nr:acetolactate decarboxylase [Flavobacteriales bacterium]
MLRRSLLILACIAGQWLDAQVAVTGAMRKTMWEGQLSGLIAMDSIANPGTYGIGPVEYLRGEVTLVDGHCFVSSAINDSTMQVQERTDVKAPFFVRAMVSSWVDVPLPPEVVDLPSLDAFLTTLGKERSGPFVFRIDGLVTEAHLHVMDVPPGTEIHGPDDAHASQKNFTLRDVNAELVGFFSTKHKAVFTHHDTNIHVHLLTMDRSAMGHLERLRFDPSRVRLKIGRP